MSDIHLNDKSFKPAIPKLAATVIICRKLKQPRDGFDYEILFVKRKDKARFMPGYHVFPGGITEKEDEIPDEHPLLPSPIPSFLKDPKMRTLRLAATREVFEESNVLLCEPVIPPEILDIWRPIVLKDCSQFNKMCLELNCKPNWKSMYEWVRWITPEDEKYRYDTYFYLVPIDRQLNAAHDNFETTRHDWITPKEVLMNYNERNIKLAPPTWITCAELCTFSKLKDLISTAKKGRDLRPILPRFHMKELVGGNEIHLCLPGDKDSTEPVSNESLRRLVIKPGCSYKFISSDSNSNPWDRNSSISSKL